MGFNITEITNKSLGVQEQTSYGLVFVPPRFNVNFVTSGWGVGHYAHLMDGFKHIVSTTQGGYIHFRFRGRRIGILLSKNKNNGKINFDVDGTDYGQYDSSFADWYQSTTTTLYNIPVLIATDLPDGEHVLTITKADTLNTSIQGFLVDDSGTAPIFLRANFNYHEMLDTTGVALTPLSIGTSDTTIKGGDTWLLSATFTNTTASPINVSLKNGNGSVVVGPFPIPANDIRQLQGPIFLGGTSKAIASATGVIMTIGGQ